MKKVWEIMRILILCDIYGVDDQPTILIERAPMSKRNFRSQTSCTFSNPVAVSACTKIYKREILIGFSFQQDGMKI